MATATDITTVTITRAQKSYVSWYADLLIYKRLGPADEE